MLGYIPRVCRSTGIPIDRERHGILGELFVKVYRSWSRGY
jgi:hypothetical protein